MTEYSRMAKGYTTTLTGGGTSPQYLPFTPDYVEWINYTAMTTPTSPQVVKGYWDVNMGQGAAAYDFYASGPVYSTATTTTGGVTTFTAGQLLQYGATKQVVGITTANPASVTVTGHGYASGDVVIFEGLYQSSTTGMIQICSIPFTITVTGTDTFTIPWNTNQSNYTAISGSPTGATVKKVLYPYLYEPGANVISAITTGTTTTIDTTSAHNFVVGQEVAFRIPTAWGTTQLNSSPNNTSTFNPVYGYVVSVTDYNTFVVNINSTGFTAFNSNQAFATTPGLTYAQVVAVGDVNTGGVQISAGSQLYPPPYIVPIGTTRVNSINGPAIQGAFFNNTNQGFVIGTTAAPTASQVIYWRAYLHDIST